DLTRLIAKKQVGKNTNITVIRDGREKTITVTLSKRDVEKLTAKRSEGVDRGFGFRVDDLSPETAPRFGFEENESGVVVVSIDSDSKAADAGLQIGDLIKEVNRHSVNDTGEFSTEMKAANEADTIQLLVKGRRGGYRVIKLEQ
ncbi:MAG: PDZ domain-containing protein, partial [Thermodesulfobacteriota bacterium]|nr:PDZ domain-containing protein [Thermodesulfobacteriota bacterium]